MKVVSAFVFIAALVTSGCNQQDNPKAKEASEHTRIDTPAEQLASLNDVQKIDTTTLEAGSQPIIRLLEMTDSSKRCQVNFTINQGKALHAILTSSDTNANIRINQVGFPDHTFTGPFGRILDYPINQLGQYKIIISENQMAGDPWTGKFQIKIWVE